MNNPSVNLNANIPSGPPANSPNGILLSLKSVGSRGTSTVVARVTQAAGSGTYCAWTEILTLPGQSIWMDFQVGAESLGEYLDVEIGMGAAGFEVPILRGYCYPASVQNVSLTALLNLPAGTRLAIRSACGSTETVSVCANITLA